MNGRIERAALALQQARIDRVRLPALGNELRPQSESEGYAVQFALQALETERRGAPVVGWKIGCTTPVMRELLGIATPCAGGVHRDRLHGGALELPFAGLIRPGVECEIAFRLARDLDAAAVSIDEAGGAVGAVMAAMEVVEDRYESFATVGAPTLIADDFFQAHCLLGPEHPWPHALDLAAARGRTLVDGTLRGEGVGAAVMGHPLAALAWLAERLHALGRPLRAGHVVLTGSLVAVQWLDGPALAETEIEGLGRITARFV